MKPKFLILALLLVFGIIIASCSPSNLSPSPETPLPPSNTLDLPTTTAPSPTKTDQPSLLVAEDIQYAKVNLFPTKLDIYSPNETGPWPIVIIVHGLAQTRKTFSPMAEDIAAEGAVVYNIDVNLNPPYIDSIHRISCAIRYVRATANEYAGNLDWIILAGHSGGGLTGIIIALAGDDFGQGCFVEDGSVHIDAFIGYEGVYEFITTKPPDEMIHMDYTYLEEEDPDLWLALNPYTHIGRNPGLIVRLVHGGYIESSMMSEVPEAWSENLELALKDAGYDVELIIVEGADHDDIVDPESDAYIQFINQVRELCINPMK